MDCSRKEVTQCVVATRGGSFDERPTGCGPWGDALRHVRQPTFKTGSNGNRWDRPEQFGRSFFWTVAAGRRGQSLPTTASTAGKIGPGGNLFEPTPTVCLVLVGSFGILKFKLIATVLRNRFCEASMSG